MHLYTDKIDVVKSWQFNVVIKWKRDGKIGQDRFRMEMS